MAHRALACALERLAPVYRERMVSALARALADDDEEAGLEYLSVLDAGEIRRAHRLAMTVKARRDVALSEHRSARRMARIETVLSRLANLIRRK